MSFQDKLLSGFLLFDGGMGTLLQARGYDTGDLRAMRAADGYPDAIREIVAAYREAGAQVCSANTFQVNEKHIPDPAELAEIVASEVAIARAAGDGLVALDLGPLGALMAPMGTLTFADAYRQYALLAEAGQSAGADLVILETMSDLLELKAGVLAVREHSALPVVCSMTYGENGRTFLGCDPLTVTLSLQALGVDALGANCSFGPDEMLPIIQQTVQHACVPVIAQPNAGLPITTGSIPIYETSPAEFAESAAALAGAGARLLGGCCGTTPNHIRALRDALDQLPAVTPPASRTPPAAITSRSKTIWMDQLEALDKGHFTLDAGMDPTDAMMEASEQALDHDLLCIRLESAQGVAEAVQAIQGAASTPLALIAEDPQLLLAAARVCTGIPLLCLEGGSSDDLDGLRTAAAPYGVQIAADPALLR